MLLHAFKFLIKNWKDLDLLTDTEKLEFVRKSVSWIEGWDIMDTCFILNFGYKAPLPWPQV